MMKGTMDMSDTVWVAVIALGMAVVNMIGSVLMLWIRARYGYRNGATPPPPVDSDGAH